MKLLLLFTHEFWLRPYSKTLPEVPDFTDELRATDAVVALVHVEQSDAELMTKMITKGIKNIKWLAGKFGTKNVILHSFAHLGTSKAAPELAERIIGEMSERLRGRGFQVQVTPFGYFNEFKMHVAGPSLAKVFVEL